MKKYLLLGLALLVSACATAPSKEEIANADFGKDMSAKECQTISEKFIKDRLKDPDSAKFKFGTCEKSYASKVPILGLPTAFGWKQEGAVNSKNSFGGYTGYSKFVVLMKNGKPIRYCFESRSGDCFVEEA